MILPNRLSLVGSMVERGAVVADIGTDHAYLPVWLVQQGICPKAFACDVKEGPLEKGRQNIAFNHLGDKITTRLSDGINGIKQGEADTFVIAGMGADVIIHILSQCAYSKSSDYTFIIQPMSRYYVLIKWLYENGFDIVLHKCTAEGRRHYTVMKVVYSGRVKPFEDVDTYLGAMDLQDSSCIAFLKTEVHRAEKRAIGNPDLKKTIDALKQLIKERKMTTEDILKYTETFAPVATALDFDNCGILVGDKDKKITKAIVALDITHSVVKEAVSKNAQLIISHHPVIFNPLKRVNKGSVVYELVKNDITALCLHTNLDISPEFGVNTELAKALKIKNGGFAGDTFAYIGEIEKPVTAYEFAQMTKNVLDCKGLRYTDKQVVKKVCVSSGAGAEEIFTAVENGCDLFLTGEMKHHLFIEAMNMNIAVVEVGHFKSEDVVIAPLVERLSQQFPSVHFEKAQSVIDNVKYI
jgi:dinuclear metal center YbgI/SA1388 family protein